MPRKKNYVTIVTPSTIRSAIEELGTLCRHIASVGHLTPLSKVKFVTFVEHILQEIEGDTYGIPEEDPIFPTPESEKGET